MEKQVPLSAIGIDFGLKSIGIAVGQTLTGTANELAVIRSGVSREAKLESLSRLKKIIDEWQPGVIVVGWPLNMDGSESELCSRVQEFVDEVKRFYGRPVVLTDERLTSREAKSLKQQHSGFKDNPVDALAAKLILESWLRQQPQKKPTAS